MSAFYYRFCRNQVKSQINNLWCKRLFEGPICAVFILKNTLEIDAKWAHVGRKDTYFDPLWQLLNFVHLIIVRWGEINQKIKRQEVGLHHFQSIFKNCSTFLSVSLSVLTAYRKGRRLSFIMLLMGKCSQEYIRHGFPIN